jgi:hypothetical protein
LNTTRSQAVVRERASLERLEVMPEGEPRWIADPTKRHELRWWNGARWTEHVCDAGVVGEDWGPKGPPVPRRQQPQPRATQPAPRDVTSDVNYHDADLDDGRDLLEESPRRQRERARRTTILTTIAVIVILAVAIAVAVTVTSS